MAKRKSWASWFPIAAKPHNVGFRMSDAAATFVDNLGLGKAQNAQAAQLAREQDEWRGLYLKGRYPQAKSGE